MTPPFSNLTDWLNYLSYLAPVADTPAQSFLNLKQIAERLNLKTIADKIIAITGTNGKGSVVSCLEQISLSLEKKIGSITSPHLLEFNERIRINAKPVSAEKICGALNQIEQARQGVCLNYSQYAYLAGFLILQHEQVSLAILEVGIGGRFDAINIFDNDMTIITNVDYDHCELLGDSREMIGIEKAQLIRPGTPVIIGDRNCPLSIHDYAKQQHAILYCLGEDYDYQQDATTWSWSNPLISFTHLTKSTLITSNVAIAIQAATLLYNTQLNVSLLNHAVSQINLPGRHELIRKKCLWWLDVAHNPQAVGYLAQQLSTVHANKIYALIGMMRDKALLANVELLWPYIDEWHVTTLPSSRSATIQQWHTIFSHLNPDKVCYYDDIKKACKTLEQCSIEQDIVVIFGSFITVAEVKKWIKN